MNYSTYRFTLDIHQSRSQVSIPVMFQDTWVRFFINLTDGGKPYKIADGCRAVLYGKKADGTALVNDCEIIDDNTRIVYTFNEQTASCIGSVGCEIRLYGKDGLKLTTPSFAIWVEERVIKDDEIIESEDEKSAIDRIFDSEDERVKAEAERQAAETAREEKMEELESRVAECEDKVGEGGSSAENSQRLEMLEQDVAEHGAAISAINEALDKKADADTMNTALAKKADAATMATELAKLEAKIGTGSGGSNYDDTEIKASIAEFDSKVSNALSDSKSYTDNRFNAILGEGGTDKLDTLGEIAKALGKDENFSATILGRLNSTDADIATLMAWMNESNYVPLKFSTSPYVSSGSSYARGQSVSSVTVSWRFNKTPETLTVNGVSETNTALTSKTFALSTPITYQNTSSNTWSVSGSVTKPDGSKDTVSGRTSAITFGNYVISGYTSTAAFNASVHAPSSMQTTTTLKTSRPTSFTGTGKGYIYLLFPASLGTPTGYKYKGLSYKFEATTTVSFTNKHGHTESYVYCRTSETLTSESRDLTIEY